MANFDEFSEQIRTGSLDFALLKPVDTQFLISFPRANWSQLPNALLGAAVVGWFTWDLAVEPGSQMTLRWFSLPVYLLYVACGIVIMYSVMIAMASTSIWLGRNQNLYDFWFYVTNFYRYPMEIYQRGTIGWSLWGAFTFVIPILIVSNVPARVLAQPLGSPWKWWEWGLAAFALLAAASGLWISRQVFQMALRSYRSASS